MKISWFGSLSLLAIMSFALMPAPLLGQSPETVSLFRHKCAICHGNDGAAHTMKARKIEQQDHVKVKDLRSAEVQSKLTDAQMAKFIADGKQPGMDGFGKEFTKAQIQDLVKYIRSLKQ